ncbi:MAG: 3-deoxy-8-phosphooctulonate synthase [Chlamydiales bacterium]
MAGFTLDSFFVICGPCVIENELHTMQCAEFLTDLFRSKEIQLIFKASYDKANRSSINSFRGPGIEKGLKILKKIREEFHVPILTDIHSPEEASKAAEVCDILQIPAFLSRQTDLLLAAANTGAMINVKKGQFMAPWDMKEVVNKITSTGNHHLMITERGTTFGYNNLVSDLRGIPIMQKLGYPIIYDATHSVQLPGSLGQTSGGEREFIPTLSAAALAAGANGIYAESHPDPVDAKSDSALMIPFSDLPDLLDHWLRIFQATQLCVRNS